MRTPLLWLPVVWLASSASAQAPLALQLACRSVALTTCRQGFCATQLDAPGGSTRLTFDLARATFTMPPVRSQPTPMTAVTIEPGSPNHKLFEAKFQIALAERDRANVDLIEVDNGTFEARATTTFVYPDGLTAITGYACERRDE